MARFRFLRSATILCRSLPALSGKVKNRSTAALFTGCGTAEGCKKESVFLHDAVITAIPMQKRKKECTIRFIRSVLK
jgi:hypothetical protein